MKTLKKFLLLILISTISFSGEYERIEDYMYKYEAYSIGMKSDPVGMMNEEVDRQLDLIYKKLLQELDKKNYKNTKANFIEAQKQWMSFLIKEAHFVESFIGKDEKNDISHLRWENRERLLELAKIYDEFLAGKKIIVAEEDAKENFESIDKRLNRYYNEFLDNMNNTSKTPHYVERFQKKFIIVQREWLKFREKEIKFLTTISNSDKEVDTDNSLYWTVINKINDDRTKKFKGLEETLY